MLKFRNQVHRLKRLMQLGCWDWSYLRWKGVPPRSPLEAMLRGALHTTVVVALASGVRLSIDLDRAPLSDPARLWLLRQPDRAQALLALASAGDDYEIVATAPASLPGFTVIGAVSAGAGVDIRVDGQSLEPGPGGWRHG